MPPHINGPWRLVALAWLRLVAIWERVQVELHGKYSLQRLQDVSEHIRSSGLWENAALMILTPVPCLLFVALLDCVELEGPTVGFDVSYRYWGRLLIVVAVFAFTEFVQLHITAPILQLNARKVVIIVACSSSFTLAMTYALVRLIGYPVPFLHSIVAPAWFMGNQLGFSYSCGHVLKRSAQARKDVNGFILVIVLKVVLTNVYPMYAYIFNKLDSVEQTLFVLLLPCIKIAAKNWIHYVLTDMFDMKPEMIVFNVEIFNALYVSLCRQSSTSIVTTIALLAIDLVQAVQSVRDLLVPVRELEGLLAKMPRAPSSNRPLNIIEAALNVIELDRTVSSHASVQALCRQTEYKMQCQAASTHGRESSSQSRFGSKVTVAMVKLPPKVMSASTQRAAPATPAKSLPHKRSFASAKVLVDALAPPGASGNEAKPSSKTTTLPDAIDDVADLYPSSGQKTKLAPPQLQTTATGLGLSSDERLLLVQRVTQVLYMVEFIILVEYAEVVTPVILCESYPALVL